MINKSKTILIISGVTLGAVSGLLYWKFVGCQTGTCPITSNPFISSAYGAVMGGLGFSFFKEIKNKK